MLWMRVSLSLVPTGSGLELLSSEDERRLSACPRLTVRPKGTGCSCASVTSVVGADRSLDALVRGLDEAELTNALPYVQAAMMKLYSFLELTCLHCQSQAKE